MRQILLLIIALLVPQISFAQTDANIEKVAKFSPFDDRDKLHVGTSEFPQWVKDTSYWQEFSDCSAYYFVFGNYEKSIGEAQKSSEFYESMVYFGEAAIKRLVKDRAIDEGDARIVVIDAIKAKTQNENQNIRAAISLGVVSSHMDMFIKKCVKAKTDHLNEFGGN